MKKTLKDKAKEKKATTIGNKNETTPSDEGMEEEDPSLMQQLEAELDGAVEVDGDGAAEGDEEAAEVGDGSAARNLDAELDGAAEAAAKKRKRPIVYLSFPPSTSTFSPAAMKKGCGLLVGADLIR